MPSADSKKVKKEDQKMNNKSKILLFLKLEIITFRKEKIECRKQDWQLFTCDIIGLWVANRWNYGKQSVLDWVLISEEWLSKNRRVQKWLHLPYIGHAWYYCCIDVLLLSICNVRKRRCLERYRQKENNLLVVICCKSLIH